MSKITRNKSIRIRIDEELLELGYMVADIRGLTLSELIRELLLNEICEEVIGGLDE